MSKKRKVVGYSNYGMGRVIHKCYRGGSGVRGGKVFACKKELNHVVSSCGDKFTKTKPRGKKMCVKCGKIK